MPFAARLYVAVVIALGILTFVIFFPRNYPDPVLFIALGVVACWTSAWKVTLPISVANGATLSVSYAACLMALLLLGTEHAMVITAAGFFTQTFNAQQAETKTVVSWQ